MRPATRYSNRYWTMPEMVMGCCGWQCVCVCVVVSSKYAHGNVCGVCVERERDRGGERSEDEGRYS